MPDSGEIKLTISRADPTQSEKHHRLDFFEPNEEVSIHDQISFVFTTNPLEKGKLWPDAFNESVNKQATLEKIEQFLAELNTPS